MRANDCCLRKFLLQLPDVCKPGVLDIHDDERRPVLGDFIAQVRARIRYANRFKMILQGRNQRARDAGILFQ